LIIANHVSNDAPGQGLSFAVHTTPRGGVCCKRTAFEKKRLRRGGVCSVDRHLAEPSRGLRRQMQRFLNALHLPVLAVSSFTAGLKLFPPPKNIRWTHDASKSFSRNVPLCVDSGERRNKAQLGRASRVESGTTPSSTARCHVYDALYVRRCWCDSDAVHAQRYVAAGSLRGIGCQE
jgi:hypothetical protein